MGWVAQAKYYTHQAHKINLDLVKRDAIRNGDEPYAPSEILFHHILKVDDKMDYFSFLTFIISTAYKCFVIEREIGGCRHFTGVLWDVCTSLTNLGLGLSSPFSHTETTWTWYSRWSIMTTSAVGMFICPEIIQNLANKHKLDPQTTKSMGRLGQRSCDDILKDGASSVLQCLFKKLTIKKYVKMAGLDIKKLDYGLVEEMDLTDDQYILVYTYVDLNEQLDEKLEMWKIMREQIKTMYEKFQKEVLTAEAQQNILWHYRIIDKMETLSRDVCYKTEKIDKIMSHQIESRKTTKVAPAPESDKKSKFGRRQSVVDPDRSSRFHEDAKRRKSMVAKEHHVDGVDGGEDELIPHSRFMEDESRVLTNRIHHLEEQKHHKKEVMRKMLENFEEKFLPEVMKLVKV